MRLTDGMTKEQKKEYFDKAWETRPKNRHFIYDCDYHNGQVCIFPKDWQGGSVSIDYTQLDDLIQELLECKKYYQKLEKIRKNLLTNQKQYDII